MPERRSSPFTGVYRKPYHRDPLVYIAIAVSVLLLLRRVVLDDEGPTGWALFELAVAPLAGFTLVAFVGGFFRDPPPDH